MEKCIACQKAGDFEFRAVEVQTLHVREFRGERRIQALGGTRSFALCRTCAEKRLKKDQDIRSSVGKRVLSFAAILLGGIVLEIVNALFMGLNRVFLIFGLTAVVCGILGIFSLLRMAVERRDKLAAMKPEDALLDAAWEEVLLAAPKKYQDSDLSYVPVNSKTLAMKNGDLMIVFNLLPEIAIELHKRLRQDKI